MPKEWISRTHFIALDQLSLLIDNFIFCFDYEWQNLDQIWCKNHGNAIFD